MAWRRLWFMVVVSRTAGMTGTAAVDRRPVVRFGDMPHSHPPSPAAGGRRLSGPPPREGSPAGPHSCRPSTPSHASDAAADPPVGVAGASAFPPGPTHVPGAVAGSGGRSHRTAVHVVERLPPAVLQRRDRHRAGRAAPPGGGPRRGLSLPDT